MSINTIISCTSNIEWKLMLALSLMKQLDFTMKLRTKHIFQQNIFKFSKQYFCEYEFRWNSFFCFMIICFPISGKVWNGNFQHNIWIWKLLNLKCCSRVPLLHGADEKTGVSVRMTLRSIASLRYESGRLSIFHFGRAKLHLHINQIHAFDGVKFLYRNPAQKSVVCLFAKCRHIWFSDISARSHQIGKWKWNKITFQCGILVREAIFRVLTAISDPDLIYVNCRFP